MSEHPAPYGPGSKVQLARILEATGCRSRTELAELLGISLAAVARAKKSDGIPADWLVRLTRLGINSDWIVTGIGPRYMPSGHGSGEQAVVEAPPGTILQDILRCFPTQALTDELDRRRRPLPRKERIPAVSRDAAKR